MYLKSTKIYFPNQICRSGYLEIQGEKIKGFCSEVPEGAPVEDWGENLILPGFIDQHIHGWGTGSFNNDKSVHSIQEMKKIGRASCRERVSSPV